MNMQCTYINTYVILFFSFNPEPDTLAWLAGKERIDQIREIRRKKRKKEKAKKKKKAKAKEEEAEEEARQQQSNSVA